MYAVGTNSEVMRYKLILLQNPPDRCLT